MRLPIVIPVQLEGELVDAFGSLANMPGAFFLDSGEKVSKDNRYSFAGIDPIHTFKASGGFVTLDGHTTIDNPLSALQKLVAFTNKIPACDPYLPFAGGLVGSISFEWGNSPHNAHSGSSMPDLFFNFYDTIVTFDHMEGSAFVSSLGLKENGELSEDLAKKRADNLARLLQKHTIFRSSEAYPPLHGSHPIVSSLTKDNFINGINALKDSKHLPLFAQQFSSPTHKTPWQVYLDLRSENQATHAAYLSCDNFHILSASRTCLIKVTGDKIKMKPTKGSRGKGKDRDDNLRLVNELNYDPEIQASHRYLVADIIRNLDSVCVNESVQVEELPHVETDARSHHLISTVSGKKSAHASAIDCLLAVISASPDAKISNLISRLECVPRNIYTGTIGFIGCNGTAEFNSAFRTMILKDTIGYLHAGAEVGMNTEPEEAYINTKNSANHIFKLCHTRSI